jgi:hypothetical protein
MTHSHIRWRLAFLIGYRRTGRDHLLGARWTAYLTPGAGGRRRRSTEHRSDRTLQPHRPNHMGET